MKDKKKIRKRIKELKEQQKTCRGMVTRGRYGWKRKDFLSDYHKEKYKELQNEIDLLNWVLDDR